MTRGRGGTRAVVFFPKVVQKLIEDKGYQKSKKGGWYKPYMGKEEFIAMPSCEQKKNLKKNITWYVFSSNPHRPLLLEDARKQSIEFELDFNELEEAMLISQK